VPRAHRTLAGTTGHRAEPGRSGIVTPHWTLQVVATNLQHAIHGVERGLLLCQPQSTIIMYGVNARIGLGIVWPTFRRRVLHAHRIVEPGQLLPEPKVISEAEARDRRPNCIEAT
jgi:hypothetical protein